MRKKRVCTRPGFAAGKKPTCVVAGGHLHSYWRCMYALLSTAKENNVMFGFARSSPAASKALYGCCLSAAPASAAYMAYSYVSHHQSEKSDEQKNAIINNEEQTAGGIRGFVASLFVTPIVHERELRHVVVPCGNVDFDVYLLGTNHRGRASRQDVQNVLELVHPDIIFVELCRGRQEILDDYEDSEYYVAAQYRSRQINNAQMKTPVLLLGDRPYRTGDLRWWESIESTTGRIATFLLWPFLLPFRARFMGHQHFIEERDTFMAYAMHKGCAYYVEQKADCQARAKLSKSKVVTARPEKKSLCGRFTSQTMSSARSLLIDTFFTAVCSVSGTHYDEKDDKPTRNPSLVAIVGASHLDGICSLLEDERGWPIEMMLEVCESERHPRNHQTTQNLARNVEEYDRASSPWI